MGAGAATITAVSMEGSFIDSIDLTVEARPDSFASLIGANLTGVDEVTFTSDWFGSFRENTEWNSWIYQEGIDWLYTGIAFDASEMWVWSAALRTWVFTGSEAYPWLWVVQNASSSLPWVNSGANCWVYFYVSDEGVGWLYYTPGDSWIVEMLLVCD